jgi:hypothetical protein
MNLSRLFQCPRPLTVMAARYGVSAIKVERTKYNGGEPQFKSAKSQGNRIIEKRKGTLLPKEAICQHFIGVVQ